MPKCSLIVNVYNQAKQLDLLLESACKQTENDFEIIVADDGSSDETKEVVQKWKGRLLQFFNRQMYNIRFRQ